MDAIRKIEAALAAGPTDGPWEIRRNQPDHLSIYGADGYGVGQAWNVNGAEQNHANAALMIACDPKNIREVLAELAAREAEIARLREVLGRVMLWIDNWSPEFASDPEWPIDRDAARAALTKQPPKD